MLSKTTGLITSFLLGCFATITQVILFREQLQILEGNELGLSLLLFGWLAGLTVGAPLARKLRIDDRLTRWLRLTLPAISLLLAFGIAFVRFSPILFSIPSIDKPSPFYTIVIALLPVVPAGALFGFAFPLMTSVLKHSRDADGRPSTLTGTIFAMESIGGVVAGLLISLRFLIYFHPFHISFFMIVASLLILSAYEWRTVAFKLWLILAFVVVSVWVAGLADRLNGWSETVRWNNRHAGYNAARCLETPYQRLEIGLRDEQYTVFGNGSPLFSFPNEYESVHWAHLSLSQRPDPESILLLGGRGGDLIRNYLYHHPKRIVCCEMDPGILNVSEGLWDKPESDVVQYVFRDPRRYLSSLDPEMKFSAIVVDQADPSNGLLNRFYTREFFQLVEKRLEENGVMAISITGTPNNDFGDAAFNAGTLYRTLSNVFPQVLAIPGTEWWFFASISRPLTPDPDRVGQLFDNAGVSSPDFSSEFFSIYYDKDRIKQVLEALQSGKTYLSNSDRRPLCYLYNLILWTKQYGWLRSLPIERMAFASGQLAWIGMALAMFIYGLISLSTRAFVSRSGLALHSPLATLAATGLSVMTAEIVILLYYQSVAGCLYQQVGLFFGTFMMGLAIGSAVGVRMCRRSTRDAASLVLLADLCFLVSLLLTPLILFLLSFGELYAGLVEWILLFWLTLLAAFTGLLFPMVAKAIESDESGSTGIAGKLVACDNLGGALAALVTGTLLIPIFGMTLTLLIFFGVKTLSVIAVYRWYKQMKEYRGETKRISRLKAF